MPKVLSYRGGVVLAVLLGAAFGAPTATRAAPGGQAAAGFNLTAAPVGNASAALQWNAQTDVASYRVYGVRTMIVDPATADPAGPESHPTTHPLARADAGTWIEIAKDLQDTSATLTDLPREGTYAFVVRAVDAGGREYAQTAAATVSLATAPGDDLAVEMPTFTAARLTWEAVPGAARYALLSAPAGRPLAPDRVRQGLSGTTTTIDGLPPSSTWRFAVVAQDASGRVLAQTRTEEVTTLPPLAPMFGMR
jgi:hypothetical protein